MSSSKSSRFAGGPVPSATLDWGPADADPTPPAWWFLWRLVRFRPWLWFFNLWSITLLIVIAMAPGIISREFFNRLSSAQAMLEGGPLGLPGWLWWLGVFQVLSTIGKADRKSV